MLVHFRPIFLGFVFLALGIFLMSLFTFSSHLYLIIPLIGFVVYFLVVGCARLFSEKFFAYIKKSLVYMLVCVVAFGAGVGLFALTKAEYKADFVPLETTPYQVTGVIDGHVLSNNSAKYFFLENVHLYSEDEDVKLERNLRVYVANDIANECSLDDIKSGDQVFFSAYIKITPVFRKNSIDSFAYKNNFQHTAYIFSPNIYYVDGKANLMDITKNAVHQLYEDNFDPLYAGFAYSIISGDRSELDHEMISQFSRVGIAHIVAISGLHVGFLVLLLLWPLNRLRLNKWIKLTIVINVLLLYAIFCGASPSVVRACIMAIILLIGNLFGKQNDNLNNVSLAGILILLISPLFLFDLGFLLSFAGVFGIFCLYPVLKRALRFLRWKWLIESLAVTLSADIATLPIIANAFGYVSLVSSISNLVLVPIFGFVFMLLFVLTILCLLLPFLGVLLKVCQWGLMVVERGASYLASLPFASFNYHGFSPGALIAYYAGMFSLSRYVVPKYKVKVALISACYATFLIIVLISFI